MHGGFPSTNLLISQARICRHAQNRQIYITGVTVAAYQITQITEAGFSCGLWQTKWNSVNFDRDGKPHAKQGTGREIGNKYKCQVALLELSRSMFLIAGTTPYAYC